MKWDDKYSIFFKLAMEDVLKHEGGFTVDHAGETNYGISLRFLKTLDKDWDGDGWLDGDINQDGFIDPKDIKNMTEELAVELYYKQWWLRNDYDRIEDVHIACKVMDLAVNMGSKRCHILLQESTIGLTGRKNQLKVDGIIGPKTISVINTVNPRELLLCFQCRAHGFYDYLARSNPNKFGRFLEGWLNRVYD